jgi:ubiquinone/menaquinone biosynthesis C-methylase UbiE
MSESRQTRSAYDAWHERVSSVTALDTPWHRLVQRTLDRERDLDGKRVLEIACGRGELAQWCAAHGRPSIILAVDFSLSAVRLARARLREGCAVRFVQADAQAIALPSASVDTIISCETIEHVPDPRAAIREMSRVLRPGGRLFLTTPNYLGPIGAYRAYLRLTGRRFTEDGQPINHFLIAGLVRQWMRNAGFRIARADSSGHYLPFPGRPPILLIDSARWLGPFGLHALTIGEKRR